MKRLFGSLCVVCSVFFAVSTSGASLIQNGDFETGSLNPWVAIGDVAVQEAGALATAWGMDNHYAGLGAGTSEGLSGLGQVFHVAGLSELVISFNWFLGHYDTWRPDDTFAALLTQAGVPLMAISLLELQTSGTLTDPDLGVAYGLYKEPVDISGWTLDDGIIAFSLYESGSFLGIEEGVLIGTNSLGGVDNVSVAAVPEPATVLLMASGLLGLAGYRNRKRPGRE